VTQLMEEGKVGEEMGPIDVDSYLEAEEISQYLDDEAEEVDTCEGCREDQPNQLAHMGPGGCLAEDVDEGLFPYEP
jgi:hypothetical protein